MASSYEVPSWAGKPPPGIHLDIFKDDKFIQKIMIDEKKVKYIFIYLQLRLIPGLSSNLPKFILNMKRRGSFRFLGDRTVQFQSGFDFFDD